MEIPDIIVINKADHPMTDTMVREVRGVSRFRMNRALESADPAHQATRGEGVAELAEQIDEHRPHRKGRGRWPSAAPATCAARSSGSPPRGCGGSSRLGGRRRRDGGAAGAGGASRTRSRHGGGQLLERHTDA